MQWFRLHNKLLNDPTVQGLSPDQFKVYINLLCYASSIDRGGYIGTLHETAFALRETIEHVTSCFNAFQGVGLIVTNETDGETFQIPQWKKKQYESDSSTERVKKHREKVKRSKTVTVTPSDTDTDTEQIQSKTLDQSKIDRGLKFDRFWHSGIRKVSKKKTEPIFNKLLLRATPKGGEYSVCEEEFTVMLINDIRQRLNSNQLGFAEMHPTTYLNGERWNDEVTTNGRTQGHEGNDRPNQTGRPSVVDRVKRTAEERERNRSGEVPRASDGQALDSTDGNLRPQTAQPIRGDDTGSLGDALEGHFTRAD